MMGFRGRCHLAACSSEAAVCYGSHSMLLFSSPGALSGSLTLAK